LSKAPSAIPALAKTRSLPSIPSKPILKRNAHPKRHRNTVSFGSSPVSTTKFYIGAEPPSVLYSVDPLKEYDCTVRIERLGPSTTPRDFPSLARNIITTGSLAMFSTVLRGVVLVKNLAYDKSITVRYTFDNWDTFTDLAAYFTSSASPFLDKFQYDIDLASMLDASLDTYRRTRRQGFPMEMQFAVRYESNGQVFWDNNDGRNHRIEIYSTFTKKPQAVALEFDPELQEPDPVAILSTSPPASLHMAFSLSARYNFATTSTEPYTPPTDFLASPTFIKSNTHAAPVWCTSTV
jgi:hypothetical protein